MAAEASQGGLLSTFAVSLSNYMEDQLGLSNTSNPILAGLVRLRALPCGGENSKGNKGGGR